MIIFREVLKVSLDINYEFWPQYLMCMSFIMCLQFHSLHSRDDNQGEIWNIFKRHPLSSFLSLLRWYLLASELPMSFCVVFLVYQWWQWWKEMVMHSLSPCPCQRWMPKVSHLSPWKSHLETARPSHCFICFVVLFWIHKLCLKCTPCRW